MRCRYFLKQIKRKTDNMMAGLEELMRRIDSSSPWRRGIQFSVSVSEPSYSCNWRVMKIKQFKLLGRKK